LAEHDPEHIGLLDMEGQGNKQLGPIRLQLSDKLIDSFVIPQEVRHFSTLLSSSGDQVSM
jgi:hypothetical protein